MARRAAHATRGRPERGSLSPPLRRYLGYLARHRLQIALGVVAAGLSAFIATITPRIVGAIFDEIARQRPFDEIRLLALAIVLVTALEVGFRVLGRLGVFYAARAIETEMRADLFGHLQRLHAAYFQHQRTGDLMARMTNDLTAVRMMSGMGIMGTVGAITTTVFSILAMLSVNATLTLLALVLLPFSALSFWFIGRRVNVLFQKVQEQFGELSAKAQENFSGIRVVKAFSQEQQEIKAFAGVTDEYARRAISLEWFNGLSWPTMNFMVGAAILTTLYFGGQGAIRGEMTVGQLVQFIAYLQLLSQPMAMLGEIMNVYQQGFASLGRLQRVFDATPTIDDPSVPEGKTIVGSVEFRHVSFTYGRVPILSDISFAVPPGGSIAIVGATGSGKSSLVNLVPRLFDVSAGQVLVDGVDVRVYPLRTLRRAVGYVPQETFLFSLPLRDNVGFGVEEPLNDEQLDWTGDVSQLNKDVVDFPAKYDTMIGERGVTLSGGQKQRSAIARAVAKDPRILILDDALSAVDTYTEADILRRLRSVMKGRTSIIVAHRISTVKDADEILVLADGVIAERGTHRALLEQNGRYAQMYRRQLLEEELEVDEEQEEHERRVHADAPAEGADTTRATAGLPPSEDDLDREPGGV